MLWGARNTAKKYHWRGWGVLAVYGPHWVCTISQRVCFPSLHCSGSRLLCRELSKAGPGLRALPRSKLLRFRFSCTPQRHRLSWVCIFCHSQVSAAQTTRFLVSTISQEGDESYHLPGPSPLVSWVYSKSAISGVLYVSSGELISGSNCPGGCQSPRIPGRLG